MVWSSNVLDQRRLRGATETFGATRTSSLNPGSVLHNVLCLQLVIVHSRRSRAAKHRACPCPLASPPRVRGPDANKSTRQRDVKHHNKPLT